MEEYELDAFEAVVKPVMEYLAKNHNPHKTLIITSDSAQLVEALATHTTQEFIPD
ncbi:hypothetical protein [Serratia sp. 14-2641]|uniref:hypothetical protein n=1 Tax=Serratia sp. 14-2641 TaxID=1841657 RepID=UPI0013016722|nr:hypothetical protein [Serratia sp. 14-2641]